MNDAGFPPSLAGIATMQDAMRPGLSVDACVARLKRYHYSFKRLHQIFTARITAEPIYELKTAFSLHAWLCAEHVHALRKRIAEMREPPLELDAVPDSNLETFFDEILCAPTTEELIVGLYDVALAALRDALQRHVDETNPLADHPSVRVCKFALVEVNEMIEFGSRALPALGIDAKPQAAAWRELLSKCVENAGALDGASEKQSHPVERIHSSKPYVYDPIPKRDERFIDAFNRGVNPEGLIYDSTTPDLPKVLMMLFKRLREIDVPEMMASIITQTPGKPWEYYRLMSRQLWDEARHAMMGEVGFNAQHVDWTKIPIPWGWSLNLNTRLTPIERHAVLYFIEHGLMPKTGKRFEWEVCVAAGDHLAALFQDYDWADEVLHNSIGRQLYAAEFPDNKQAIAFGERAWAKVQSAPDAPTPGLTEHRNWWPDVYREACKFWGIEPDPRVLEYDAKLSKPDAVSASG